MSGNLVEFLKVLTIVVTMSSIILSLRNFMTNFDENAQDSDDKNEANDNIVNDFSYLEK